MNDEKQIRKAENFLALHRGPDLLTLPNIWDPLGARLMESLEFPAVATASAAVAYSLGYDDGERIGFSMMLDVIERVASSVSVPVSADIEAGYAEGPDELADNVSRVLDAGVVGINLEDSRARPPRTLYPVELQCDRISAVRLMADRRGIPLVINARLDAFIRDAPGGVSEKTAEAITRGNAYVEAGADCVFPVALADFDIIKVLRKEIDAPLNVTAMASTPLVSELEAAGINRLSFGPGLLKVSLTAMEKAARVLQSRGSFDAFTRDVLSSEEIETYVSGRRNP